MKKIISLVATAFILTAATGQKIIHDPNAEVRNVNGFHAIEISGGIDMYLSNGDEAVAVSAKDDDVRAGIKTEVKDGVLKIWYERKSAMNMVFNRNKALKVYVAYKTLDRLEASGGCDVTVEGGITVSNLAMRFSGGSDFRGKVNVSYVKIEQSGGSDFHINGNATTIDVNANGGSDFLGYDLISQTCTINSGGGSDIEITVNKELSAEASGASDISWKGNATVKKAKASGAASVSHKS